MGREGTPDRPSSAGAGGGRSPPCTPVGGARHPVGKCPVVAGRSRSRPLVERVPHATPCHALQPRDLLRSVAPFTAERLRPSWEGTARDLDPLSGRGGRWPQASLTGEQVLLCSCSRGGAQGSWRRQTRPEPPGSRPAFQRPGGETCGRQTCPCLDGPRGSGLRYPRTSWVLPRLRTGCPRTPVFRGK